MKTNIYTVGYEKTEIAAYVEHLVHLGIELLIDVRERPISRKRGFSKNRLRAAVEDVGIRYLHVVELGDPKPGRDAARAGQHDLFLEIFAEHMESAEAGLALTEVAQKIVGKSVCLTCFEKDHEWCHRSVVADRLSELTNATIVHSEV